MARLTAKARKKIPTSKFAIRKGRRFPIDTKGRARSALRMIGLGKNLTKAQKDKIKRMANTLLGRKPKKPTKATVKRKSPVRKMVRNVAKRTVRRRK